ncbi:hypothetical protein NW762_000179 [Fusarium torreyae]|uniref:Clr5 domain-containing protein n=1 Tax=Fusarium torreyae TaxID=1237075 RepID=A0A9W8VMT6_9HYPO|nr:hypothetical protein NW762_000179 [Fusarium torreyae]
MLRILNDEDGFDINSRELMRVRARNRWLLRVRHGDRARSGDVEHDDEEIPEDDASPAEDEDMTASLPDQGQGAPTKSISGYPIDSLQKDFTPITSAPKPRKISKRQSRRNRQNLGETEHIVRFPSEMTLNDSKEALNLDANTYLETRECFANICQEESIFKKTLAGPGRWDYVKNRLIHERPNLQQVLWLSKENLERKQLALDIICTDVTKRLRNRGTKMTLVDAKNELGLNPEESHEVRTALHEVLCNAKFTCKSDGTPEQWEELKKQWIEKSVRLKTIPLSGDDEQSRRKVRAIEIVARDVIKRKRDEKRLKNIKATDTGKQKEASQQKSPSNEPQRDAQDLQPEPEVQQQVNRHQVQHARHSQPTLNVLERRAARSSSPTNPVAVHDGIMDNGMDNTGYEPIHETPTNARLALTTARQSAPPDRSVQMQPQASNLSSSHGILPQPHRLLGSSTTAGIPMNAQYGSSMYLGNHPQSNFMEQQYVPHQFSASAPGTMFQAVPAVSTAFAIFLRLHPSSTYVTNTSLWISTMTSQSIQELRQAAVAKFPGALCVRIEGILRDPKGAELPLQIQGDDELGAYFAHMQGGSPTFSVQLV